jgi:hypothetical protein
VFRVGGARVRVFWIRRGRVFRVGGACGPPPPVAAPLAGSLRAPSRGDPPRTCCRPTDAWQRSSRPAATARNGVTQVIPLGRTARNGVPQVFPLGCTAMTANTRVRPTRSCSLRAAPLRLARFRAARQGHSAQSYLTPIGRDADGVPLRPERGARTRGVAAGRSAQRACERSSDWRRGAAGSPDPEYLQPHTELLPSSPDPENLQSDTELPTGLPDSENLQSDPYFVVLVVCSGFSL